MGQIFLLGCEVFTVRGSAEIPGICCQHLLAGLPLLGRFTLKRMVISWGAFRAQVPQNQIEFFFPSLSPNYLLCTVTNFSHSHSGHLLFGTTCSLPAILPVSIPLQSPPILAAHSSGSWKHA